MTTTAVQPIEKFCSEKLIMCKYVNDLGSCRLTACARQFMPMTINEAIDFLNKSKWTLAPHALGEAKWNEAVDMAIEALSAEVVHKPDYSYEADMVRRMKEALSVDRPTGEWRKTENDEMEITGYYCSMCDMPTDEPTRFCPNCGAKMEVKE
jgi:rubrerythrin